MKRVNLLIAILVTLAMIITVAGCQAKPTPVPPAPTAKPAAAAPTSAPAAAPTAASAKPAAAPTTAPTSAPAAAPTAAPAKPAAPAKVYKLKASTYSVRDHVLGETLEVFKREAEKRTNGAVQMDIFYNAQLYKAEESLEATRMNSVQLATTYEVILSTWDPAWNLPQLPFFFNSYEQWLKSMETPAGKAVLDRMDKKGLKTFIITLMSPSVFYHRSRPLTSIVDFKGQKFRSPTGALYMDTLRLMGSSPVSISAAETYTALQQGMVDGALTNIQAGWRYKWGEVLKNILTLPLALNVDIISFSSQWWNSLPPDIQIILEKEVMPIVIKEATAYSVKDQEECITGMKDTFKVKFNEASPQYADTIRGLLKPIYTKYEPQIGKDLMDAATQIVAGK